jgi:release factor glutamine methyltransferase
MKKIETLAEWFATAIPQLAQNPEVDTPQLEAQLLGSLVLGKPRAWLLAHTDLSLSPDQLARLTECLNQRLNHIPLPYITGSWEFFGLDFFVSPHVLIPRPETELLVTHAIDWLKRHPQRRTALEIGSGSGCISISLAVNMPDLNLIAVDISGLALGLSIRNTRHHQVEGQISFLQSDLASAVAGRFDLICANLPYIPTPKLAGLEVSRFEPRLALDGGPDGLDLVRSLLTDSPRLIKPGSLLLFEIEAGQGESALAAARSIFPQADCQVYADLAGLPRLLSIEVN